MALFDSKYYVYAQNKWVYHVILLIGFVVAVKILPFINDQVTRFTDNIWLQQGSSWLLAYVAAVYILPELGFMLYKALTENKN